MLFPISNLVKIMFVPMLIRDPAGMTQSDVQFRIKGRMGSAGALSILFQKGVHASSTIANLAPNIPLYLEFTPFDREYMVRTRVDGVWQPDTWKTMSPISYNEDFEILVKPNTGTPASFDITVNGVFLLSYTVNVPAKVPDNIDYIFFGNGIFGATADQDYEITAVNFEPLGTAVDVKGLRQRPKGA